MMMPNEKEQFFPFNAIVKDLHRLCLERRSGTLYIYTDEGHGATFTLVQGKIVDIFYGTARGLAALEQLQNTNMAKSIFKNDSGLRKKQPDDTEYLPASNVILHKLGMEDSAMRTGMGDTIKKILIVEDSALSRKVITNMLAGKNYEVVEAKDGIEALDMLKQGVPDLVLLDLILPKMDGYEVLRNMKQNKNYKEIPVIVLTSRDALFDKLKGKMSGTDEYLTKPVDAEKLMSKVKKYLG